MNGKELYGFIRSWLMYFAKPCNQKKLTNFYSQFIQPGDLVFDIGAHIGNRSDAFISLGAKVIAVEPQPICVQYLKKKFYNVKNFILLPAIISNAREDQTFYINSLHPTISTARNDHWKKDIHKYSLVKSKWDKSILVKTYTLDALILMYGFPSFCKIDTEGYEWEVLKSLSKPVKCISIEYLEFDKSRTILCFDHISGLGDYKVNFSKGETQKWLWNEWKNLIEVKSLLFENKFDMVFGDFYFIQC